MFTMRRTVAEGVRICTARAAPRRIGPDRDAVRGGRLQQVERNVRCIERRHDEQVRCALEPGMREDAQPDLLGERGVAVHLALHFELWCALGKER
jgi:hypothetical protein